jgi:acyl-CoA hydrolase
MLGPFRAHRLLNSFRPLRASILGASLQKRAFSAVIYNSPEDAVADIPHGATIGFGGFALVGIPEKLIEALRKKGTKDII